MTEATQKNILIVDDLESMRRILKRQIGKKSDATVFEAWNIESAMDVLGKHEISLIISDMHLKDENVCQLIDWLSEKSEGEAVIPIVVITSDMDRDEFEEVRKRPIFSYMLKPFSADQLGSVLQSVFSETTTE